MQWVGILRASIQVLALREVAQNPLILTPVVSPHWLREAAMMGEYNCLHVPIQVP